MKNLCGSLVALAIVALRNGGNEDAARLFSQAAYCDGAEDLIEDLMRDNYEAVSLCQSISGNRGGIKETIEALSASLAFDEESDMYDDEFVSLNADDEGEDDEGVDNDFLDEDGEEDEGEDDLDVEDEESTSSTSSLIRLNF